MKFQALNGDVPARLPAICAVTLRPGASIGCTEVLAGLSSMPLSSAHCDGLVVDRVGSVVQPEWHFRQSWYS